MSTYIHIADAATHASRFAKKPGRPQFSGSGMYNAKTGHEMDLPQRRGVCAPSVIRDVPEHIGPDGKTLITSRSKQREVCKTTDTVPWESGVGRKRPKGLVDAKIAKASGKKVCVDTRDHFAEEKQRKFKAVGLS